MRDVGHLKGAHFLGAEIDVDSLSAGGRFVVGAQGILGVDDDNFGRAVRIGCGGRNHRNVDVVTYGDLATVVGERDGHHRGLSGRFLRDVGHLEGGRLALVGDCDGFGARGGLVVGADGEIGDGFGRPVRIGSGDDDVRLGDVRTYLEIGASVLGGDADQGGLGGLAGLGLALYGGGGRLGDAILHVGEGDDVGTHFLHGLNAQTHARHHLGGAVGVGGGHTKIGGRDGVAHGFGGAHVFSRNGRQGYLLHPLRVERDIVGDFDKAHAVVEGKGRLAPRVQIPPPERVARAGGIGQQRFADGVAVGHRQGGGGSALIVVVKSHGVVGDVGFVIAIVLVFTADEGSRDQRDDQHDGQNSPNLPTHNISPYKL